MTRKKSQGTIIADNYAEMRKILWLLMLLHGVLCTHSLDDWHKLRSTITLPVIKHHLQNQTQYNSRYPFPYTYIDRFFPEEVISNVDAEVSDNPILRDGCVRNATICLKGKNQHNRNIIEQEVFMGPATTAVLSFMRSSLFVRFLEQLTGIDNLITDPHHRGGGVHQTLSGGFMHLHADQHRLEKYNLDRRVVVYLYLNKNWEDRWGGHLELWARNLKTCYNKIRPDFNRMVIFTTSEFAYHGYMQPLGCPKSRSRRSLAVYYYTTSRPSSECIKGDCSISRPMAFQSSICSCSDPRCQPPAWATFHH